MDPHAQPAGPTDDAAGGGQGLLRDWFRLPVYLGCRNSRAAPSGGRRCPALCAIGRRAGSDRLRHVDGHPKRRAGHGSLRPQLHPDDPGNGQAERLYREEPPGYGRHLHYRLRGGRGRGGVARQTLPAALCGADLAAAVQPGVGRQPVFCAGKGIPARICPRPTQAAAGRSPWPARWRWGTRKVWSGWC